MSALVPYFVAYQLRICEVSPASLGSISAPKRFLIGVPKTMVEEIQKEPLLLTQPNVTLLTKRLSKLGKRNYWKLSVRFFQRPPSKKIE